MTQTAETYTASIRIVGGELKVVDWEPPPQAKAGIYEIFLPHPIPRLRGTSRTLYIGRSINLKARLSQLENWEHGVTSRVDAVLRDGEVWSEAAERVCTVIARVTPEASSDPELEEIRLLTAFEREHCELPPLNRSAPGRFGFLVLQRLIMGIADQLSALRGVKAVQVRKPWDHEAEGITHVEFAWRRADRLALAWVWPESWSGAKHRPEWWPDDARMPFRHEALFLHVDEDWNPYGRTPVKPGQLWCRQRRKEDPWLMHVQPIALPGALLDHPTEAFLALLAKGRLGEGGPVLKAEHTMSQALRAVWADLEERLGEAAKSAGEAATAERVAAAYLAKVEPS